MNKISKCIALLLLLVGASSVSAKAEGFSIVKNEEMTRIDVLYNQKLITSYLYADTLDKPVLYPLITPDGVEVTRGYPLAPRVNERTDHPHHIGVWFNFGDVNGLDFWNNSSAVPAEKKANYGSVRHRATSFTESGQDKAEINTESDWINHKGDVLLKENTRYVFRKEGVFLTIERETKLTAVQDTVVFTDNKEGLFAIRVAREFEEKTEKPDFFILEDGKPSETKISNDGNANGVYLNSEGVLGADVWAKPAKWVVLSARKDGLPVSIAIFDHPENPGYPAYSHARGYGLFSMNNLGRQVFNKEKNLLQINLKKGEMLNFKHKLLLKSGGFADADELNELHREFK